MGIINAFYGAEVFLKFQPYFHFKYEFTFRIDWFFALEKLILKCLKILVLNTC